MRGAWRSPRLRTAWVSAGRVSIASCRRREGGAAVLAYIRALACAALNQSFRERASAWSRVRNEKVSSRFPQVAAMS